MRLNLPITSQEYEFPADDMLVSTTDTRGHMTHCNPAFVLASGYDRDELLGQPHNMIRHPDMPAQAFKDLWATIGHGHAWTGIIKNRRKDGGFYWVRANVTPIIEDGKPRSYMSVRVRPDRAEVKVAEALYAQLHRDATTGRRSLDMVGGRVRQRGVRGMLQRIHRLPPAATLGFLLVLSTAAAVAPWWRELERPVAGVVSLMLLLGQAGALLWCVRCISREVRQAERFASELAACNLRAPFKAESFSPPLAGLARNLNQIQVNLRAVVGDVRAEIDAVRDAATEIAQGGNHLSARTEAQASSVQQTRSGHGAALQHSASNG